MEQQQQPQRVVTRSYKIGIDGPKYLGWTPQGEAQYRPYNNNNQYNNYNVNGRGMTVKGIPSGGGRVTRMRGGGRRSGGGRGDGHQYVAIGNPKTPTKMELASDGLDIFPVLNNFPIVDIGVNLSHGRFSSDLDVVIKRALKHNVTLLVCTGTSENASIQSSEIAAKYPEIVYSTAGVHPHDAKQWSQKTEHTLRDLAKLPQVVAIGECGLDFDRNFSEPSEQLKVFEEQVKLAIELQKPLFLHERKAHKQLVQIIQKFYHCNNNNSSSTTTTSGSTSSSQQPLKACIHCFTGTEEELNTYIQMGFYIGITGWICDERRGEELRKTVQRIPLNRIMIETDAPFLVPRTKCIYPSLKHVTRNEPCLLPLVLKKVAECMNVSDGDLAVYSTHNAIDFFGIKK